ncbi:hypothetical protein [Streptomyces sp. NPDC058683]|uniref:hypothetical protein n=1 Tax=Streptomyces sp. NPDC058683 TaxID=3346597 RepID=UPI00364C6F52
MLGRQGVGDQPQRVGHAHCPREHVRHTARAEALLAGLPFATAELRGLLGFLARRGL